MKHLVIVLLAILTFEGFVARELSQVKAQQTPAAKQQLKPAPTYEQLKREADSLRMELFLAKYRVARVRYYVRIAEKRPSQRQFLLSWVARAIQ